jgi:L-cystine uptake protein TcyP (sodium:dicarboxylate symporter family)
MLYEKRPEGEKSMAGVIITVLVFCVCLAGLAVLHVKKVSFNIRVIVALIAGIVFGIVIHNVFAGSENASTMRQCLRWIGIPGDIYLRLLRMMVIPLIFVSIVCAIINQKSSKTLGKITALVLIVLLGTTAISAVIGSATAKVFGLSSEGLEIGAQETARTEALERTASSQQPVEQTLIGMIPTNPFYALTGQGSNATLSVVIFAVFVGLGVMGVRSFAKEAADFFEKFMNSIQEVVVEIVMKILAITPYGIFALMAKTVAGSDYQSIVRLATFVLASYIAMFIMFIIHGIILSGFGLNPITFFRKAGTALTFAFTSRSSLATLPLTTSTLYETMGVDIGTSNLAASLGTSIGQNGCAGIYPAMLVMMVAPAVGRPITPGFFILTVIVVTFASIGIAGVGGGATFAGITVLSILGLPVGIAGLLIAVEPMIDMARTALNVSDGMLSAIIAGKFTGGLNKDIYNDKTVQLSKKTAA